MKKKEILAVTISGALLLTVLAGCGNKGTLPMPYLNAKEVINGTTAYGDEVTTEAANNTGINTTEEVRDKREYLDLYQHKVEGNSNLYHAIFNGISDKYEYITKVTKFNNKLIVSATNGSYDEGVDGAVFYVDPESLDVIKKVEIDGVSGYELEYKEAGDRVYFFQEFDNTVYVADENLNIIDNFDIEVDGMYSMLIDSELSDIYYLSKDSKSIEKYDVDTKTVSKVYTVDSGSINYIDSFKGATKEIYFSWVNDEDYSNQVKMIYNLNDGTVSETDQDGYYIYNNYGEKYSGSCYLDTISYTIYGDNTGEYVYGFKSNDDYNNVTVDLASNSLIHHEYIRNEDDSCSTGIILKLYDLKTGKLKNEATLSLENDFDDFYAYAFSYFPDRDIMTFVSSPYAEGTEGIYVIDMEETKVSDSNDNIKVYDYRLLTNESDAVLNPLKVRANEIADEYGFKFYIGDDVTENVYDSVYEIVPEYSYVVLDLAIDKMEEQLARYPKGMIAQLDDDYTCELKIYFVNEIVAWSSESDSVGNAAGLQNTLPDDNYLVVDVGDPDDFIFTFNHELFHAIEGHVNNEGWYIDYNELMALNPGGFEYSYSYSSYRQDTSDEYILFEEDNPDNVYFIDSYCKIYPHEERARLFEYAMVESEKNRGTYDYYYLNEKLKLVCELIRNGFDTTGWPDETEWEMQIK